jgi:hypothetical protein|tara:strand:- start:236 stop:496 length:261 start_codon:yes stop_codon:yes gene_type:complete
MQIKPIGSNMTELQVLGMSILFSYQTPVAGWDGEGAFRTEQKFSATTSKHINKYLGGKDIGRNVSQSYITGLVDFSEDQAMKAIIA